MKKIETQILSKRGTQIPVTIVEADEPKKLLLLAHGFKANRTEDGRFLTVAEALAKHGVSSIMPGFAGCDVSKEDFINYSLNSCIDDINTCYAYMMEHYPLNPDSIGMIGYSMGGRLTSLYIADHPEISCIGLWAAASYDGFGEEDGFLGVSKEELERQCEEKGYVDFHNGFDNTDIRLSKELIDGMKNCKPSKGLSEFKGAAIIVHGDEDVTVPYKTATDTYAILNKAKERKLCTVKGADHGFGAWNERPDLSKQLTDNTIAFFEENFI
ncbi:MAG: alpha/beta hydrolase [Erysipelotrichaceae bacterium]|jgi:esterase/lipase|nr:alpha/beta hydrolase [Erysipelotrichaceae bacterium]MBQ1625782.1 alpha/beta hydrolase [Erysipelotrichaceae bacterium]MBQ2138057.1 alpha/beta hydrolase [Erysipelotrichaceae bacterium]MBQ9158588.1 alpha/beta hydrolase [Erysipelotrichaceae bacterium]MBR6723903.1 alpha/beta hydrolase [Erysipelotrichaceae bacterium]